MQSWCIGYQPLWWPSATSKTLISTVTSHKRRGDAITLDACVSEKKKTRVNGTIIGWDMPEKTASRSPAFAFLSMIFKIRQTSIADRRWLWRWRWRPVSGTIRSTLLPTSEKNSVRGLFFFSTPPPQKMSFPCCRIPVYATIDVEGQHIPHSAGWLAGALCCGWQGIESKKKRSFLRNHKATRQ